MKRIFLLLTIVAAATNCVLFAQRKAAEEMCGFPLHDGVERVTSTHYSLEISSGKYVRNIVNVEEYLFNEAGNVAEEVSYNPDKSLDFRRAFKYDSKGNKTEVAKYKSDGSLDKKAIFKYDSNGNMTEEAYCRSDGSLGSKDTYKYEYDSKGNKTEKLRYYPNGSLWISHKYDSKGNETEEKISS